MLVPMQILIVFTFLVVLAVAAQLRGVDTREILRPFERTGSWAPLR